MNPIQVVSRLICRFRYQFTLPEDIAHALGVDLDNSLTFDEFISKLTNHHCHPTRLEKYMSRSKAEGVFTTAQKKERFRNNTLISYYFSEGWVEFDLHFDNESKLRRLYIQHRQIKEDRGIELALMTQRN